MGERILAHPYARQRRIGDLIKREIARLLLEEAQDPRFVMLSVTGVQVSKDYANAKVFVTLMQNEDKTDILNALNKANGFLRFRLSQNVKLRGTPQLHFHFDDTLERSRRIEEFLAG